MENIYQIASEIFKYEPQDPHSIQLQIVNHEDLSIVFEVMCILFGECLELKLPGVINNNRNVNNFIMTLKEYFHSFGMNFDYIQTNNNQHHINCLTFQPDRTYQNIELRTDFLYHNFLISYEPGIHNSNTLQDFKLSIKIGNIFYQITFKHYR